MTIAPAIIAVACLADAFNCVLLGHDDWWFPALSAALCAAMIRPVCNEADG